MSKGSIRRDVFDGDDCFSTHYGEGHIGLSFGFYFLSAFWCIGVLEWFK